jgi:hypothetical protein
MKKCERMSVEKIERRERQLSCVETSYEAMFVHRGTT